MIRSLLLGFVAGARSMTPLAAVSAAAWSHWDQRGDGAPGFLARPKVLAGALALAAGELLGDKLPSAPDRIVAPGLAARIVTGALAGASVAPKRERTQAMVLGAGAAVVGAYLTFNARMWAIRRWGQTRTGLVEDALTIAATSLLVGTARR